MTSPTANKITFFEFFADNAADTPAWFRSMGRDSFGATYIPAVTLSSNEAEVQMRAMYDGIGTVMYQNHLFVPLEWVALESQNEAVQTSLGHMRRHMATVK